VEIFEDDKSPDTARREMISGVCKRIVGWTPVDFGEGVVEFTHDNAVKLFMDPRKGAYFGQVVDFLTAERAFMKGSANS
jgi:hypothetical protein